MKHDLLCECCLCKEAIVKISGKLLCDDCYSDVAAKRSPLIYAVILFIAFFAH